MQAIADALPVTDGVSRFNHLYLEVTRSVGTAATAATFEDAAFLSALDVGFAGLYFAAADAAARGGSVSRSWAPLFAARHDPAIAPIQFALAGMNAHINHDLAVALVATCLTEGIDLDRDSPQHRDFIRVNDLLSAVEAQVKQEYLVGLVGLADDVLGRVDDVVAMWSVVEARGAAWTNAEMLWAVRDVPALGATFDDALDGLAGAVSRGLLVPTLS